MGSAFSAIVRKWDGLPKVDAWRYSPIHKGEPSMEFRLVYRGALPAETSHPRKEDKARIRSSIHPQLRELWNTHPRIKWRIETFYSEAGETFVEHFASRNKVVSVRGNHIHRFIPLITEENYDSCSVEVLFLRRDSPGGIVRHGGDIDNRIKVLLDALRKPKEPQELEDIPQSPDEDPCFCLFSDDKYIDQLTVTTDRLLTPQEGQEHIHDVMLVIRVVAMLFNPQQDFAPA
jgi:hypothetical protein